jgi:D-threo-aldose 1-dehydrogenase
MNASERRRIGRTELTASLLGFGSAPLGDLYARLDDATALATVDAAFRAGVTLFDSSPFYGHGLAEHRLGTIFRRHDRDSFVFSTKVARIYRARRSNDGPNHGDWVGGFPHQAEFDYSYDGTMRAFEQSLLRTGLDRIDILLIHDVDVWTHGPEAFPQRFREAMDGAYRALDDLRSQRVIRAIGAGINEADTAARFARAGEFDCFLLAGRYTLLEQGALDDFLPLCEKKGIGILLGGVFNSGILARGAKGDPAYNYKPAPLAIRERVTRIEEVCAENGVALATAALHFAAAHPVVASLVIGAVTPDEVARNATSLATPVPSGLWSDLKTAGLIRADAPTPAST